MNVHFGYEGLRFSGPVITMGVFDGVHLGHRMLISKVVEEAHRCNTESVVVTFDPHPRMVLEKGNESLRFLTDITERIMLLEETGIDHLVVIPFTNELSNLTACDFIEKILCEKLCVSHLVAGFNHHFGKRHEGTGNTIMECSSRFGFSVTRAEPLILEGVVVSSSVIRDLLLSGETDHASRLLGYPYFITGRVVPGERLGRSLGFPTANIEPHFSHKIIPKNGVYAVEIELSGYAEKHKAMLNIGRRPTVTSGNTKETIEAHILDFDGDLYDKSVVVRFRHRLRDEMKFDTRKKLTLQLYADKEQTMRLLK